MSLKIHGTAHSVTNRVKEWCVNNNIINKQQNGFRSEKSTNDNLFKLSQSLKQNINKKFVTSVIFFEVEKAFDQVQRNSLLRKIKNLGKDKKFLRWINSFLNERTMLIKTENTRRESF